MLGNCTECGDELRPGRGGLARGRSQGLCPTCYSELRLGLPTPDEIAAECVRIRAGWDLLRWAHELGPRRRRPGVRICRVPPMLRGHLEDAA